MKSASFADSPCRGHFQNKGCGSRGQPRSDALLRHCWFFVICRSIPFKASHLKNKISVIWILNFKKIRFCHPRPWRKLMIAWYCRLRVGELDLRNKLCLKFREWSCLWVSAGYLRFQSALWEDSLKRVRSLRAPDDIQKHQASLLIIGWMSLVRYMFKILYYISPAINLLLSCLLYLLCSNVPFKTMKPGALLNSTENEHNCHDWVSHLPNDLGLPGSQACNDSQMITFPPRRHWRAIATQGTTAKPQQLLANNREVIILA